MIKSHLPGAAAGSTQVAAGIQDECDVEARELDALRQLLRHFAGLREVSDAWPTLSESLRGAVLAIVRAAHGAGE